MRLLKILLLALTQLFAFAESKEGPFKAQIVKIFDSANIDGSKKVLVKILNTGNQTMYLDNSDIEIHFVFESQDGGTDFSIMRTRFSSQSHGTVTRDLPGQIIGIEPGNSIIKVAFMFLPKSKKITIIAAFVELVASSYLSAKMDDYDRFTLNDKMSTYIETP